MRVASGFHAAVAAVEEGAEAQLVALVPVAVVDDASDLVEVLATWNCDDCVREGGLVMAEAVRDQKVVGTCVQRSSLGFVVVSAVGVAGLVDVAEADLDVADEIRVAAIEVLVVVVVVADLGVDADEVVLAGIEKGEGPAADIEAEGLAAGFASESLVEFERESLAARVVGDWVQEQAVSATIEKMVGHTQVYTAARR